MWVLVAPERLHPLVCIQCNDDHCGYCEEGPETSSVSVHAINVEANSFPIDIELQETVPADIATVLSPWHSQVKFKK